MRQYNQPLGPVSKEPNKQSIARIFGIKKNEVAYSAVGLNLTGIKIVYSQVNQLFYWTGLATGNLVSLTPYANSAIVETSTGSFNCVQAKAGDWLQSLLATSVGAASVGANQGGTLEDFVGGYASVDSLKSYEPSKPNQRVYLQGVTVGDRTGSGYFYHDPADTTSANDDWLVLVTAGGKRWKRDTSDSLLNLSWAGIKTGDDLTTALKQAIAYLKAQVVAGLSPAQSKLIAINSGLYDLTSTIEMPTAVRIVALGNVEVTTTLTGRIFDIKNDNTIPKPSFGGPGAMYPSVSGIGGTFTLTGPGKVSGGAIGFIFGNEASGYASCRDVGLSNVIVRYCGDALRFRAKDTYLLSFESCRFEQNFYNLRMSEATAANSGEAHTFTNCIFGASGAGDAPLVAGAHIWANTPSMELVFDKCKFDYTSGDVLLIGSQCNYSSFKFINVRGEEWRGFFVAGTPSAAGNVSVMFTNLSVLPRNSANTTVGNSPSRPLFNIGAGVNISVVNLEVFNEMRPYTEDMYLSTGAGACKVTNLVRAPYRMVTNSSHIMNRGSKFEDETTGTVVGAATLTRYVVDSISNITGNVVDLDGGKSVQLVASSTASYCRFMAKDYIPVRPGDVIGLTGAIQGLASTGNRSFAMNIVWYDKDLNIITSSVGDSDYSFNTAYTDTTLPNYATGNTRKLAANATTRTAPAGAAFGRPRWQIAAFSGTLNVINLIAFRE